MGRVLSHQVADSRDPFPLTLPTFSYASLFFLEKKNNYFIFFIEIVSTSALCSFFSFTAISFGAISWFDRMDFILFFWVPVAVIVSLISCFSTLKWHAPHTDMRYLSLFLFWNGPVCYTQRCMCYSHWIRACAGRSVAWFFIWNDSPLVGCAAEKRVIRPTQMRLVCCNVMVPATNNSSSARSAWICCLFFLRPIASSIHNPSLAVVYFGPIYSVYKHQRLRLRLQLVR